MCILHKWKYFADKFWRYCQKCKRVQTYCSGDSWVGWIDPKFGDLQMEIADLERKKNYMSSENSMNLNGYPFSREERSMRMSSLTKCITTAREVLRTITFQNDGKVYFRWQADT